MIRFNKAKKDIVIKSSHYNVEERRIMKCKNRNIKNKNQSKKTNKRYVLCILMRNINIRNPRVDEEYWNDLKTVVY